MSVTVRRAVMEDAPKIAEFASRLVDQHIAYDSRRFSRIAEAQQMEWFYGARTEAEDAAVLIAELDGEAAGFAYLQFEEISYRGLLKNSVWLHDIFIDEAARGHHVGTALIAEAVKIAKGFGAERLMLSVAVANARASEFFTGRGFTPTMVEMMLDLNG